MGLVRSQSLKNSLSFYIGMAIGAINTVIIYPNVFKDYPEHFGLIQILVAYAVIISAFSSLGIPKTFIRFFPAIKEKGQLYLLSFLTPLFGFLLFTIFYMLFKNDIMEFLKANELLKDNFYYVIILVFFISFYDVFTSISRSFLQATTPIFINEVFLKLYSLVVLLLHWFLYVDFTAFLQLYILGYVLKFIILFLIQVFNRQLMISFSLKNINFNKIISFGLYVLFSGASIILVTRLDMIMIGSLLDLEQVAFYSVAFFIGNAIKVPGKSIASISIPLLAKAWENKDIKGIHMLYKKSSITQLIIAGFLFLCIWLNIDE